MLGSATLQGTRKCAASSIRSSAKRSIAIHACAADPSASAAGMRKGDKQQSRGSGQLAANLSAIAAAHLLAVNMAYAEVPEEALISLQGAEPLTEISQLEKAAIVIDANTPAAEAAPSVDAAEEAVLLATASDDLTTGSEPATVVTLEVVQPPVLTFAEEPAAVEEPVPVPVVEISTAEVAAEPAVASPVLGMDMPAMPAINAETDIKTLVAALIRNEQFIAALVNNEAFLDRLAGEDRVVEELARRKGMSVEVEARDELATELRRRQQMLGALAARGEEAVLAVADAAKQAAEDAQRAARNEAREADTTGELGVVSSGKSALVAMNTAVELLEDSQELLQAVEANPEATPLSALASDDRKLEREFKKMEAAVARAEQSVSSTLEKNGSEPLPAIQDAVRELYSGADGGEVTIGRAYTDLVTAVAEMQRAYGDAISKAVGHAVAEVVEVEEAAVQGAEKTKKLVGQKVEEVEKAVGLMSSAPLKAAKSSSDQDVSGAASEGSEASSAGAMRLAVIGAFLFWVWGTFVQPRSRYGR